MGTVVCFTTGGTIASRYDPEMGGNMPVVSGQELLDTLGVLDAALDVELVELANLSSTFITPEQAFGWAGEIARTLSRDDIVGAVVTHGTDTLEETAYLLDLLHDDPKPIVVTGAMRTSSESLTDGARNLRCSVQVAALEQARELGVLVVMGEQIHAAGEVTKSHAESITSFVSPNFGPLGRISRGSDRDDIVIARRPVGRQHVPAGRIETQVAYIKTVMGTDGALIDAAVAAGVRGIVLEAFAGGEVTPYMCDAIEAGREAGVEMVVATRALRGRPMDLYAEPGEGKWLRDRGVHFAGDLSGPKARIKLMLALGLDAPDRIAELFDAHIASTKGSP